MPIKTPGLAGVVPSFKFTRVRCSRGAKHVYQNGVCICGHKIQRYANLFCGRCGKRKEFCVCVK